MPCCSCVDKLARKLFEHHKIDLIRAYELAEKGMERHEKAETKTVTKKEMEALGFDPDYSQICNPVFTCEWDSEHVPKCYKVNLCTCPSPSKSHSHYVSNTCNTPVTCASLTTLSTCIKNYCIGSCYYSCDAGYVWNPVTLQCDLIPVTLASKRLLVDVGL